MSTQPGESRLAKFLDAIEKLPPYSGVTFRGCLAEARFTRPGQSVVTQGLVATSLDPDIATEGRTAPALYAIRSIRGRSIAPFSARRDEAEVVFGPGTLFHLAETRQMAGTTVHLVFELALHEGRPELDVREVPDLADHAEAVLQRRWSGPAAEFTSIPGKFAGDFS